MYNFYLNNYGTNFYKTGKQLDGLNNVDGYKIIRVSDLIPVDTRKSFGGKAKALETENGTFLLSYDTIVCGWINNRGFVRFWDAYSVTTMRHVNSFLSFIGFPSLGGKRWWDSLDCDRVYSINEILNIC